MILIINGLFCPSEPNREPPGDPTLTVSTSIFLMNLIGAGDLKCATLVFMMTDIMYAKRVLFGQLSNFLKATVA